MKFLYVTDIHDRFKAIRTILTSEIVDVAFLSGDLLYRTFYNDTKLYEFSTIQEVFHTRAMNEKLNLIPYDYARHIIANPDNYKNKEINQAKKFEDLYETAAKNIREKYENLANVIEKYASYPCWLLPGNYDMDLKYTVLKNKNIHKKSLIVDNTKFCAYGGAPILTPGIPQKLSVHFKEGTNIENCEPYQFFKRENPDIILLHQPPNGIFDSLPSFGHIGSPGIRSYVDNNPLKLCLSGHVHEDYGIMIKNGCVFMNTSNFGIVDTPTGINFGGYFAIIEVENSNIKTITIKKYSKRKTSHVFEICCSPDKDLLRIISCNFKETSGIPGFMKNYKLEPLS
jgi:Icc-related predicted phosphoesterase